MPSSVDFTAGNVAIRTSAIKYVCDPGYKWGFPKIEGAILGPNNKGDSIWGSIFRVPLCMETSRSGYSRACDLFGGNKWKTVPT